MGISPVLYSFPGAISAHGLSQTLTWAAIDDPNGPLADNWDDLFRLLLLTKPYEGTLIRHGRRFSGVRFYDEREWRFVPTPDQCEPHYYGMSEKDYQDPNVRNAGNALVQESCRLSFDPDDVKYIIVSREEEILPAIRMIERAKSPKYDDDTRRVLSSRVISAEQIATDF
jgi:hypothetical protein